MQPPSAERREHAKRLKRERSASRVLRSKSKAIATRRGSFHSDGKSVSANENKGLLCFVVRVVGLNKAGRKAWRHFLKTSGIGYSPCEFTREPIAGACVKRLRDDTLASAFLCWGTRASFRAVFLHKYVVGMERPGTTANRLTATLGPNKRVIRPGAKHHRAKGDRYYIDPNGRGCSYRTDDVTGKVTIEPKWESRTDR